MRRRRITLRGYMSSPTLNTYSALRALGTRRSRAAYDAAKVACTSLRLRLWAVRAAADRTVRAGLDAYGDWRSRGAGRVLAARKAFGLFLALARIECAGAWRTVQLCGLCGAPAHRRRGLACARAPAGRPEGAPLPASPSSDKEDSVK